MIWVVFIDAGLNQCQLIWIGGSIMFCCVIYIIEIPTTLLIKWTGAATRAINDLVHIIVSSYHPTQLMLSHHNHDIAIQVT